MRPGLKLGFAKPCRLYSPRFLSIMPAMRRKVVKKPAGKNALAYSHVTDAEKELIKGALARNHTPARIAELLDKDPTTIQRHVKAIKTNKLRPGSGRPAALTPKQEEQIVKKMKLMTKVADAKFRVTIPMVKTALKLKCSDKVVAAALHKADVYYHPLREKPVRTAEDDAKRKVFAGKYKSKPASWWSKDVHAYIDNKFFPVYLNGKGRDYAAKRAATGTFRKKGEGLGKGHVKPSKALKFNTGARSVLVSCAITAKKTLMWHVVDGRWNAEAAANMYQSKLAPALRREYPRASSYKLLEDNDPSGYKSRLGIEAKRESKIRVVEIPPRSPDLNPLDYGFWAELNRRMRRQEKKFKPSFKESRKVYMARLRRTAMNMPASALKPLVESLKRRCRQIWEADGGHIEE